MAIQRIQRSQPFKEPRGGNSKFNGPEVEKSVSVFASLRKTYGIGCRSKMATGAGTGETGVVWYNVGK